MRRLSTQPLTTASTLSVSASRAYARVDARSAIETPRLGSVVYGWASAVRGGAVNEDKMHDDHGGPVDLEVKFLDLCLYWAAGHDTPPNGLVQGNTG